MLKQTHHATVNDIFLLIQNVHLINSCSFQSDRLTYKLSDSLLSQNVNTEIMQGKGFCLSALFALIVALSVVE